MEPLQELEGTRSASKERRTRRNSGGGAGGDGKRGGGCGGGGVYGGGKRGGVGDDEGYAYNPENPAKHAKHAKPLSHTRISHDTPAPLRGDEGREGDAEGGGCHALGGGEGAERMEGVLWAQHTAAYVSVRQHTCDDDDVLIGEQVGAGEEEEEEMCDVSAVTDELHAGSLSCLFCYADVC